MCDFWPFKINLESVSPLLCINKIEYYPHPCSAHTLHAYMHILPLVSYCKTGRQSDSVYFREVMMELLFYYYTRIIAREVDLLKAQCKHLPISEGLGQESPTAGNFFYSDWFLLCVSGKSTLLWTPIIAEYINTWISLLI